MQRCQCERCQSRGNSVALPKKLLSCSTITQLAKKPFQEINKAIQVSIYSLNMLVDEQIINWCKSAHELYPIRTPGDGNCLLHAVSLAVTGNVDSAVSGRTALHDNMSRSSLTDLVRARWQLHRRRDNDSIPGGLSYTAEEWENEWQMLVSASNPSYQSPHKTGLFSYEFLEPIHVFVLANTLETPIIILGEPFMRNIKGEILEANKFVGIYLPTLTEPQFTRPFPIVLTFMMDHFMPLLFRERRDDERLKYAVPLETKTRESLPIHFLLPEEEIRAHELLGKYLSLVELNEPSWDSPVLAAEYFEGDFMNSGNYPNRCSMTGCGIRASYWLHDCFQDSDMQLKHKTLLYTRASVYSRRQVCGYHGTLYAEDPENSVRLNAIRLYPMTQNEIRSLTPARFACQTPYCKGLCHEDEWLCTRCRKAYYSKIQDGDAEIKALQYSSASSNYDKQGSRSASLKPVKSSEVDLVGDTKQIATTGPGDSKCVGPFCRSSCAVNGDGLCESCFDILKDANTHLYSTAAMAGTMALYDEQAADDLADQRSTTSVEPRLSLIFFRRK